MREFEAMNFDLEEQLVRCSSSHSEGEDKERERAFTILESSLQEKDQVSMGREGGRELCVLVHLYVCQNI